MSSPHSGTITVYAVTIIWPDRGRPVLHKNWQDYFSHPDAVNDVWKLTEDTMFVKYMDMVYQVDRCLVNWSEA